MKYTLNRIYLVLMLCLIAGIRADAQDHGILDSGGELIPEQAAYNVKYYRMDLEVKPDQEEIEGSIRVSAEVVQPMYYLVIDLDTMLAVNAAIDVTSSAAMEELAFARREGRVWIDLARTRQPGEVLVIEIKYGGKPRVAKRPPWQGGFTWSQTPSGAPWIATTCQGQGADLWWPCKDHVSDEPDSMDLYITVPDGLVVASNGSLLGTKKTNGKVEYHWFISQPINIYNVALNIAPYEVLETQFESVTGEEFPFQFYVLPESLEQGTLIFDEFQQHLHWFEKVLGPYPFRADKYGVVQTPHLGMEHQSIIAYGANFSNTAMTGADWGFDALHHHELAHEWWGNLLTNKNWEDMWIHEGIATYMQALYCEELGGAERYYNFMQRNRRFSNRNAIAPRQTMNTNEILRAPIYPKGAWIMHTLRYYLGDELFFEVLRTFVYPDEQHYNSTDGSQCRFVTTDDLLNIAEKVSGQQLDWFFEVYLRQPALPQLRVIKGSDSIALRWDLPIVSEFPMPVEISIDGKLQKVPIREGDRGAIVMFEEGSEVQVDPYSRILCEIK